MASSYIPASDSGFNDWLLNFSTKLTAAPATYGLTAPDATIVSDQAALWTAAYGPTLIPATRTSPAIATKDAVKAATLATVRPFSVNISLNASVTDGAKAAIRVTVRKVTPTPVPPPTTKPVIGILTNVAGVVQFQVRDATTPTTKAKPAGCIGVELWAAVGVAAAIDPSQARYVGTQTKTPNSWTAEPTDRTKIVTFFTRWTTRSGAGGRAYTGPWSDPVNTVIT
jgi:hypothetical protein